MKCLKAKVKTLLYLGVLNLSACWISCSQETMIRDLPYEDEFEPTHAPAPVTRLLSPVNGENVTSDGSTTVVFSWEKPENPKGSNMLVKFEVLFGPEGTDFTKIDENNNSVRFSDGEAQKPQLTLSGAFLDVIAQESGIESGQTGVLVWKVRSFCGLDETLSSAQGKLNVTRP